jgi:hypothetical protein
MADRVLLGKAKHTLGGSYVYGLWVSKPTVDVVDDDDVLADREDMLFDSTNMDYGQTLARGFVAGDAGATNVSVTVRDGVDPFVITRGFDNGGKVLSTRRSAVGGSTQDFFATGGFYVTVTVSTSGSSSTVTITPQPDLEPDVAYVILQGDS